MDQVARVRWGRSILRQHPAGKRVERIVEEVGVPFVEGLVAEVNQESGRHPALEGGPEGRSLRRADRIQNLVESIHLGERQKQLGFSDEGAGEEWLSRHGLIDERVGALQG